MSSESGKVIYALQAQFHLATKYALGLLIVAAYNDCKRSDIVRCAIKQEMKLKSYLILRIHKYFCGSTSKHLIEVLYNN
jgi:hypothetical protein